MEQRAADHILKDLFKTILRIRKVEERIATLYGEQQMRCPVHLCIGQEAIAAGVCAGLTPADNVFGAHRSHGHYLAKGGDLKKMISEIYGKKTGCCGGKGGSMHLIDPSVGFLGAVPIVGSTIPIAVGAAFAAKYRCEPRVTVVFFGEGAREEGVFHESMNFAALHRLPLLFVCENNLYSVYSPLSVRQAKHYDSISHAKAYGIPSLKGNGNDGEEVYRISRGAIEGLRSGNGPAYIEFSTYRWREHCGPNFDNDLGYRPENEFREWERRCPVRIMRDRLVAGGLASEADIDDWDSGIDREIDAAFDYAQASPFPESEEASNGIYAD